MDEFKDEPLTNEQYKSVFSTHVVIITNLLDVINFFNMGKNFLFCLKEVMAIAERGRSLLELALRSRSQLV